MPAGVEPGSKVTCSACSTEHSIYLPPTTPDAQKQVPAKETWLPGVEEHLKGMVEKMKIPQWAANTPCPVCKKAVGIYGIRNIGLCINAQHIGDISVLVHCQDPECSYTSEVFFQKACSNIPEFCAAIQSWRPRLTVFGVDVVPVGYKDIDPSCNNLTDAMSKVSKAPLSTCGSSITHD